MRHWLPFTPNETVAAVGNWLPRVLDAPEGKTLEDELRAVESYVLLMDAKPIGWLAIQKRDEGPMIRGFVIHPEYRKRWATKEVLQQLHLIFFGYGDFIYLLPENTNIIENALRLGAKQLYDSDMVPTGRLVFTKNSFKGRLNG